MWTHRINTRPPRWGSLGHLPPPRRPLNYDHRKCFTCRQEGHLALNCANNEESMPTAGPMDSTQKSGSYLTTCWAHEGLKAPKLPVRIGIWDAEALLDSGSSMTLIRPELTSGPIIPVSCKVQTTRGTFEVEAGVVEKLPVPVLIGRDCPIFWRLWEHRTGGPRRSSKKKKLLGNRKTKLVHALSSDEETAEEAWVPVEDLGKEDPGPDETSSEEVFF
ncbi:uncharacterized protein LOC114557837 [Perca flavescens]|uniref:uncharacterized protein LOC114557837 n=1 Tax=Perca flavescens TaxID=8167 RepID=UPI00106E5BA9|nr:uncharacterized protein LOC114557837 [Perca flavescens]